MGCLGQEEIGGHLLGYLRSRQQLNQAGDSSCTACCMQLLLYHHCAAACSHCCGITVLFLTVYYSLVCLCTIPDVCLAIAASTTGHLQDRTRFRRKNKTKERKRKEKKRKEKKRKEKKRNLNMLEASCSRASPFWDTWSSGGRASSAK